MSNNNKIRSRCNGGYLHKVKYQAESKVFNKCKKIGHYAKCCKTKVTQKIDNREGNRRQNPYSGQALNKIVHSPSVSQEH